MPAKLCQKCREAPRFFVKRDLPIALQAVENREPFRPAWDGVDDVLRRWEGVRGPLDVVVKTLQVGDEPTTSARFGDE